MERVAQCQCGALRAHVVGETDRVNICHCQACQRRTGAPVHFGAFWPRSQVRFEGNSRAYARPADSGRRVTFHFCPTCGSNLWFENELLPDDVGISVGCFADPQFPAPTVSVWEEHRHGWIAVPEGARRFHQSRTGPPAIGAVVPKAG